MIVMPASFDGNEWFLIISIVIITSLVVLLPRRFPTIVKLVFLFLGLGIPLYVDFLVGIPPVDLYDVNDTSQYELSDLALYFLYSPFAYIFVYFFDKWKIRGLYISLYVLGWSVVGTAYEALAFYLHVFNYKGWNLRYSFIFYLVSQSFYLFLYYIIKQKYKETKLDTGTEWK